MCLTESVIGQLFDGWVFFSDLDDKDRQAHLMKRGARARFSAKEISIVSSASALLSPLSPPSPSSLSPLSPSLFFSPHSLSLSLQLSPDFF